MRLEVLPLIKRRWDDLVDLFSRPGGSIVRGCWCMYYRRSGAGSHGGWGQANKRALKSLVETGTVPGLVGYKDGRPIGWISLGPREDYRKLERSPVMKRVDDKPVWSIVCFYVDPRERGKGVMEALLRAAIDYARSQGATLLEGYHVDKKERSHPELMCIRATRMYDRPACKEQARPKNPRPVMRRGVRPQS
ncbi:MAG: GNAT family N-acetyltransferase [Nitrospiraceae bacterium]